MNKCRTRLMIAKFKQQILKKFNYRRWGSLLPGLCMLGSPLTPAEFFRRTLLGGGTFQLIFSTWMREKSNSTPEISYWKGTRRGVNNSYKFWKSFHKIYIFNSCIDFQHISTFLLLLHRNRN